ncbi:endonuclease MutS2 [Emticicia sp. 21SJ11W-3]|uniref:endonuclease MutS2 n=1 Tax=Emticicia sp. 21SJ11W-3 TaxID=2916755 RepID=UPI0020A0E825|nr:Smr/MutS family protein [Emticicia sp. 21SJ11W-3]UTA67870.1 Smr/MutS family protein [Emticicia sp. 21SJ11W-3]
MLYPQNIEQKIGFDKIRELIAEQCISSLGRAFVEKIRFSDDYKLIDRLIRQAAEFKLILQVEPGFPEQNYIDVSDALARASIEGAFIGEDQFFEIKLSLRTIQQIIHFFKGKEETIYPELKLLTANSLPVSADDGWGSVISQIDKIIDERGKVRDSASPELADIRRRLIAEQSELRKTLERILRTARNSGWIGDDMSLTIRDGRMVIPILSEHKRKLRGFVHDESATGQMAFVEPAEVLEANNEIRELEARERREIVKILEKLTAFLRPHVPALRKAYLFLGLIDFIRAKAKFALTINGTAPLLVENQALEWYRATHPLLYLAHQKLNKSIVPLSIKLDHENRIVLVSGPNAGGKSVMLKTIGLVQYMAQCGLLVPASPDSKVGIFKNVFIDIGDEQSIENDLSTYSSHLTNMKHFVNFSNKFTLFLIDEFGTGTEPSLGGAIAESILEQLLRAKAYGVINTHYTNLKVFANKNSGTINGAMKFDAEHLEPLYELEIGKPGSSFALEVAQKIGLPKQVVDNAKRKLGTQQIDFEKLIKELEIERKVFSDRNKEFIEKNQQLKNTLEQYNGLKSFLETEKKKILNDAKAQAKELLKETNRKIESTIKEIKEGKADKDLTRLIRQELQNFESKELKPEKVDEPKPASEEWIADDGAITVGSFVRIKGQTAVGELLFMKGKDAEVAIGELKTNVKLNRLEKLSRKEFKEAVKESIKPKMSGIDLNEKMMNFSFNLDLRGKRGEEALGEVDSLMNDAIMLGYPELRIIHGKGDGILRTLIRQHLRSYKQVAGMADEHADRGGQGVTIVRMK